MPLDRQLLGDLGVGLFLEPEQDDLHPQAERLRQKSPVGKFGQNLVNSLGQK